MTDSSSSTIYSSSSFHSDIGGDEDGGRVSTVELSRSKQQRYDTTEIHRRHYTVLLNEATKVDDIADRIDLNVPVSPRRGRARLERQRHLRTVATSLRQQAMDIKALYIQYSFDIMCDELRSDSTFRNVCPKYFPKGYAKDLGECLDHNAYVKSLSLNVSRMLYNNEDGHDVSQQQQQQQQRQQHATIEPLVRFLKTSPCLKNVSLTWNDDDEMDQRTTARTTQTVNLLTKVILDAIAINSNIEAIVLDRFRSSPICLESFIQKLKGKKSVSLRHFSLHHYSIEERASMFSTFAKPAKSSRIRILLNGGNDGDFQWAQVIGYPRHGTGDGSRDVKIELDMTPARTDLSQQQAMELVLSTFPSNHQLCIQRFQWGDAVPMESLLDHLQCTHPATTTVLAPPPPRGIVKLSLCECTVTDAARTVLVQYMQTPISSSHHHHGCSLREFYVNVELPVPGAISAGSTIAAMVAMQPSEDHRAGLDNNRCTPRLVHTYGSRIQLLSLRLFASDTSFTNALRMNPDAFSMETLQLYGMSIPWLKDDNFENLVQVLPNLVALRELQIESHNSTIRMGEKHWIMLRSIRNNGSLHRVTTIDTASNFEHDFNGEDDRVGELVTPCDQSKLMSRLVRAYCQRNQELAHLLAQKALVRTDQDDSTAVQRKPPTKRFKMQPTNESSTHHAYSTTRLLPTLLSAANQTHRTRLTLMVSGLLLNESTYEPFRP